MEKFRFNFGIFTRWDVKNYHIWRVHAFRKQQGMIFFKLQNINYLWLYGFLSVDYYI